MSQFKSFLYNPDDKDLVKKVEADIPEFKFRFQNKRELIRYMIFTYDPHSDILKLFPGDFIRRKRESALKAGFKLNAEGRFDKYIEDTIVGENEQFNAALVVFVNKFNTSDLPALVMYREIFYTEFQAAMVAPDSKSKKEAMQNAEVARKQINELERRLFTDEEVTSVRNALYVLAEKLRLSLRPEHKADEIEHGDLDVNDPYYGAQ